MRYFINNHWVTISNAASNANICISTNSYVVVGINGKSIYVASKEYQRSRKKMADFYTTNKIGSNINLIKIEHGTVNDTPYKTLPLFHQHCDKMHADLELHNSALVNCNNGRSRSATVLALYLMKYLNFTTENALDLVHKVLKSRGFENFRIDGDQGINGSYGSWLLKYGTHIPEKNLLILEPKNILRSGYKTHQHHTLFAPAIKAKETSQKTLVKKVRDREEILHTPRRPRAR